jgi:nucleoside-diphosphate-sugar epimerase
MTVSRILVVGAGSVLGYEIVRRLCEKGVSVQAAYRTERADIDKRLVSIGAKPAQLDLADEERAARLIRNNDAAIFTPILTVSKAAASFLREGQGAVFFSSNNVAVDSQTKTYARLLLAEAEVRRAAPAAHILRPTMIYGYPGDGNLSRLMQMMRRVPVVAAPGGGKALQQPVYYRDLAQIAAELLFAFDGAGASPVRAVAGPAPVSLRALYRTAAAAMGAKPLILPIPASPLAALLRLVERLGWKPGLTSAQLARASRDKTPVGVCVSLGATSLEEGLSALAQALDASRRGA